MVPGGTVKTPAQHLPGLCQDASKCHGCPHAWMGPGPALGAHRHSGTDAGTSHRARRVAPACEIVGEDHITRPKTARGAIADPDFHLPRENKNVLPPGGAGPTAELFR